MAASAKFNLNAILERCGLVQPVYFGMDIDPTSIIALEINQKAVRLSLDELGVVELPSGTFVKDHLEEPNALGKALRSLASRYKFAGHNSVIAASSKLVTTHYMIAPKEEDPKKIEFQVQNEAKKAFPNIYNDIYLDYVKVKDADAEKENNEKILLVAAHKKSLQPIVSAIKSAELSTKVIDVDYYAIERMFESFPHLFQKPVTAILNVDSSSSLLVVIENKEIIHHFQHGFNIPGFDRVIHYVLQCLCPALVAEKPNEKHDINAAKLNPILENQFINQLDFILKTYTNKNDAAKLEQICLTGRSALIPGVAELIAQKFGVEVRILNVMTEFKAGPNIGSALIDAIGPACFLACGLAMRNKHHDKY